MGSNRISKKELQKFGIILSCILFVIAGLQFFKARIAASLWLVIIAGFVLLAAIFFTNYLKPVYLIFSWLGKIIGWINTKILLAVIFYILCTPLGLLRRLFQGDPLDRKIEKEKTSYWLDKAETVDFTKQY